MISGTVTAGLEPRIVIDTHGAAGQTVSIDALIDTGFTGYLTLPLALLAALGASWLYRHSALLADGSIQVFDVFSVTITWDGQPRTIEVEAIDADALVGTALLERHELRVEMKVGGTVSIQRLP